MRIKFKSEDLGEWKGAPRLKEARAIKQKLGLLPQEFAEAVAQMDPDAMSMLVSVMYNRNGNHIAYEDVDGEYTDFELELTEEEKQQAAEQETATLSPVIVKILAELGVDANQADVAEVVLRHIEEAQKEQGKEEPEAPTTNSTSTVKASLKPTSSTSSITTSTTTPPSGGNTSD